MSIRDVVAGEIVLKLSDEQAVSLLSEIRRQYSKYTEYTKFLLSVQSQLERKIASSAKTMKRAKAMIGIIQEPTIIKPGDSRWREIPQNQDDGT